jgi:hypothetical protein
VQFHFYSAPVLQSIYPILAASSGGTRITVLGNGFVQNFLLGCRFDQAYFSSVSMFVTVSVIVCVSPVPIPPGTYTLSISLNSQQYHMCASGQEKCQVFIYTNPSISDVQPQAVSNRFSSVALVPSVYITISQIPSVLRVDSSGYRCRFLAAWNSNWFRLESDYCNRLQMCVEQVVCNSLGCDCSAPACNFLDTSDCDSSMQDTLNQRCSRWPPARQYSLTSLATLQGNTLTCKAPLVVALSSGESMLLTATEENKLQGLTYVQISWNGQDYPQKQSVGSTQMFWFHSPVILRSVIPCGMSLSARPQNITLIGKNFVDSSSLVVRFGDSAILCSSKVPNLNCPAQPTGKVSAVFFISSEILVILVNPEAADIGKKKVSVSNNNNDQVCIVLPRNRCFASWMHVLFLILSVTIVIAGVFSST